MGELFFTLLYQPLYNLLVIIYNLMPWGGAGLAIIVLTLVVKGVLLPLTFRSLKAQKELQEIQPKIAEIKEAYKDDKEKQAKELMAVYKNHNVNPFASCLPTIVQLFVFLALYRALSAGIATINGDFLYSFVSNPGTMQHIFLGIDLGKVSIPLAIFAALTQYLQAKQMVTRRPPKVVRESSAALDEDVTASMNKMMTTFLPLMMLVIGSTTLAGGLTLYICISTLFTYVLYAMFLHPKPKV
ncbi:MAG: YidC/Oxa1 family membrane protein insertase [Candidatus Uhrbacteria bacterium]|nr:YidC/Oxa1 family membrane protein insertase [Candidatus Uhrbacteria bacterium]